ncbi:MAG TPA: PadR family transcriptional regulator [Gammaproteobacteria bacterium]|nr:PadR family transcriptional regulator [Gammaproteobacteria bacterium]
MPKSKKYPGKSGNELEIYGGLIRLHVLHHACEESIFGLGIIEELRRHGYNLSPGTLYPMLHGMERKGYLESYEDPEDGRRRRMYRATAAGRKALRDARHKVRELFGELIEERAKRDR